MVMRIGDPAEVLRGLGRETVEQLEAFLEEEGIELDTLIYRDRDKIWRFVESWSCTCIRMGWAWECEYPAKCHFTDANQ